MRLEQVDREYLRLVRRYRRWQALTEELRMLDRAWDDQSDLDDDPTLHPRIWAEAVDRDD